MKSRHRYWLGDCFVFAVPGDANPVCVLPGPLDLGRASKMPRQLQHLPKQGY